jgi:nitrogen fixation protein NifB
MLDRICSRVILEGTVHEGVAEAAILIEAQKRGIRKAAETGMMIKINIVLIPAINGGHIAEIARTVRELGANLINIIPLIPQHEFAGFDAPDCIELSLTRTEAEAFLPVFRHCQRCRADACGLLAPCGAAPGGTQERRVSGTGTDFFPRIRRRNMKPCFMFDSNIRPYGRTK